MKLLLIGVAAALTLVATAGCKEQPSNATFSSNKASPPGTPAPSPSADKAAAGTPAASPTATASASAGQNELQGELKKVDTDGHSLTLSSASGDQSLQISPSATITKDGASSSLEQLKEGDSIRASFDPATRQATKIEVKSKGGSDLPAKSSDMPAKQ